MDNHRKRSLRSFSRAQRAKKQRRVQQDHGVLSLLTIPQDPRIHILEYLDCSDLTEFTCVSQQCREESAHPSLSQDRWGTLTIPPNTPVKRILSTLADAQDRGAFCRVNCLKIHYPRSQYMHKATIAEVKHILRSIRLENISRLELTASVLHGTQRRSVVPNCIPSFLSQIMPNLCHVDLRVCTNSYAASNFAKHCKSLETFIWRTGPIGCIAIHADGREFKRCHNLKHLYMEHRRLEGTREEWDFPERLHFLLHTPKTLERVSLKNATIWFYGYQRSIERLIPQEALVKFVRNSPNLRWFHSDLTDENIAILEAERPEITFVNE